MSPPAATEHGRAAEQRGEPDVLEPAAALHLGADGRLEGGEPLGVPRPVVLDPVAEAREPLRPVGEDRVDDLRDRRLERLHGSLDVAERELEVGDLLRLQAAPDLPLGRHLLGLVAAAPDQVEERRRELERAGRASLREQAGHERRLRLGRRLLLVLAVVARPALAAPAPPDEADHGERGEERDREQLRDRRAEVVERVVDLALVALVCGRVLALLGDDLLEAEARSSTCIPAVEVKNRRGISVRSSTNWPAGIVERAEVDAVAVDRDVAADADRVAPGAQHVAGRDQRGRQLAEADLPLVAPDLQVDVDDVVVGDRDAAQPVVDAERRGSFEAA